MYEGTWAVVYEDDTILTQKDELHPAYVAESFEVPFKAIEWRRVKRVLFHSTDDTTEFTVQPAEDVAVAMRSRVYMTIDGVGIRAFMVTVSTPGLEVNDENTKRVIYWFPNGVTHDCPHFNCHEVGDYAAKWVHGTLGGLMPMHEVTHTAIDAELVPEATI